MPEFSQAYLPRPGLRTILSAVLAILLTACTPALDRDPAAYLRVAGAEAPRRAVLEREVLDVSDGEKLPVRVWLPTNADGAVVAPRALVVALHGVNDYSGAFTMPAQVWAAHGILTYAYDQRSFGANAHRGIWPGSAALCGDLADAVDTVRRRWPGLPVYALGESMGGAVVLDALGGTTGARRPLVDGAILAAPAVWSRATMPLLYRVALWLGMRLMPGATFTGQGLHIQASDNIRMLIALGRDPYYLRSMRTDAIGGLVDLMDEAYSARPNRKLPLLILYGARDQVVPSEPVRDVVERLRDRQHDAVTVAYYGEGWHMLLRDLEFRRVAEDVAAWIKAPSKALPSQADRAADRFLPPVPRDDEHAPVVAARASGAG